MRTGIEAINAYTGRLAIDVRELFEVRNLNTNRFDNLMMHRKSVPLPCEDAITNAVNAALPLLNQLSEEERMSIEFLIVATETAVDFGKAMSTNVHPFLGLNKRCRLIELKQACYAGTAALQLAAGYVAASPVENCRALVICSDMGKAVVKGSYFEPSQATMAVAMLVSCNPEVLELDFGASGVWGFDIMDAYRPTADTEEGDPQKTLFSYLECLEGSYREYCNRVSNVDLIETFDYLLFHTPFAGMVKGAHQKLMRKFKTTDPQVIADDFKRRVLPSLPYCQEVGNGYSASLYVALATLLEREPIQGKKRLGLYSYGSGCSSEFYSGIVTPRSCEKVASMNIGQQIAERQLLSIEEYDHLMSQPRLDFGTAYGQIDSSTYDHLLTQNFNGKGLLLLDKIDNYARTYRWS